MITSIIGIFAPLIASLLGKWMEKSAADAAVKKMLMEFIRIGQARGVLPAEVQSSDEAQKKELEGVPANGPAH